MAMEGTTEDEVLSSTTSATTTLQPGTLVELQGLVKKPTLNGGRGLLFDFDLKSDRWHVVVATPSVGAVLAKSQNLAVRDNLFEAIARDETLLNIDACNQFTEKVSSRCLHQLAGPQELPRTEQDMIRVLMSTETEHGAQMLKQKTIILDMPACAHHLLLDVMVLPPPASQSTIGNDGVHSTSPALFGRVFQSYVKN